MLLGRLVAMLLILGSLMQILKYIYCTFLKKSYETEQKHENKYFLCLRFVPCFRFEGFLVEVRGRFDVTLLLCACARCGTPEISSFCLVQRIFQNRYKCILLHYFLGLLYE